MSEDRDIAPMMVVMEELIATVRTLAAAAPGTMGAEARRQAVEVEAKFRKIKDRGRLIGAE